MLLSLVLVVIHSFFKSRIRLRARTVFATTGVSLLLGAFFPWALAAFALPAVLFIYLGLITLFAFAFSYCDMKISAHSSANPVITTEPGNEIAEPAPTTSTAFEFSEKTAFSQACAALDCNAPGADQPAHIPTETSAADLPDGITPDPVQECGITSKLTETAAGETESPSDTLLPETQLPSYMEESSGSPLDETQPDTKTVGGSDSCTNSAVPGDLQSTQDTSAEWPLPVSESIPETLWREETREPAKAAYAAELIPGQDDVAYDTQKTSQGLILEENAFVDERLLPVLETAEEHFEGCDLPAMELSPALNAAIPAEKAPALSHAKPELPSETVNENISAGFAAKASGDMVSALTSFMNAFSLNREPHVAVALAVEISNVYLELGHYPQSKLFIKSLLEQEHLNVAPIRQQLEERLLYLETFTELLQAARIPKNTPYSKVPNLVKLKANIDTAERQKK
ncbi:DUF2304 domain-containing protein [Pelotomaculum sp. FP]|uniref:DUF2304 domain-containing protein n=1 Tax=Pelotomaculum sp. FP TaxID=261474 RepID=UPI001864A9E7|nr:DUF2304 domain-containing protein [Pelotomaculum sp. FP]